MGFAFAALHWSPQQYLDSTAHEFFAGYEAWRGTNCTDAES